MPLLLILVGLVFFLKDIIPWAGAQSSGIIRRRGHSRLEVRRSEDPQRFRTLSGKRLKGAGFGLALLVGGLAWGAFNLVVNGAIAGYNASLSAAP